MALWGLGRWDDVAPRRWTSKWSLTYGVVHFRAVPFNNARAWVHGTGQSSSSCTSNDPTGMLCPGLWLIQYLTERSGRDLKGNYGLLTPNAIFLSRSLKRCQTVKRSTLSFDWNVRPQIKFRVDLWILVELSEGIDKHFSEDFGVGLTHVHGQSFKSRLIKGWEQYRPSPDLDMGGRDSP